MTVGHELRLAPEVRDTDGRIVADAAVSWTSSEPGWWRSASGTVQYSVADPAYEVLLALGWNEPPHWMNDNLKRKDAANLGDLEHLKRLDLSSTTSGERVPPERGRPAASEWIDLHAHQLTGGIPGELADLGSLERLKLYYNQLAGSNPPGFGSLR